MMEDYVLFILKTEKFPNVSIKLVRLRIELFRSVRIVLSAYITIQCSVSNTLIPEIEGCDLTTIANGSIA